MDSDIQEERTAFIFMAEQYAEQETRGNPEYGGDMFLRKV
jgi:hypothetical protein